MLRAFCENIFDAFLPKRCLGCQEHSQELPFCDFCQESVQYLEEKKENKYSALVSYSGTIREAFKKAKFSPNETYARLLLNIASTTKLSYLLKHKFDFITFVPLHKKRLLKRKFDLASIFAQSLSKKINVPTRDMLICHKYTEPLTLALSREERIERAKNKYKIKNRYLKSKTLTNKRILLLDDITTTGSTLDSAAQVLEINNNTIYKLAFAQTPLI